jgi:hypothetical protein
VKLIIFLLHSLYGLWPAPCFGCCAVVADGK